MATYSATMSGDSRYSVTLTVYETSYSVENNTSNVHYKLEATKSSGSGYWSSTAKNPMSVVINGTTVASWNVTYDFRNSTPKTLLFAEGDLNGIGHNVDGSKTISVSGSFTDAANSLGSATASGNLTLTTIPRHFTQTPKVEFQSNTTTSATFKWTTSENASQVNYKLDGGADTLAYSGSAKSGTWTISGLSANTSHTLKIMAKRADSGLWSDGNTINFSTSNKTVKVRVNGAWKDATPYVRVNGVWKVATPYTRENGQWKRGK